MEHLNLSSSQERRAWKLRHSRRRCFVSQFASVRFGFLLLATLIELKRLFGYLSSAGFYLIVFRVVCLLLQFPPTTETSSSSKLRLKQVGETQAFTWHFAWTTTLASKSAFDSEVEIESRVRLGWPKGENNN